MFSVLLLLWSDKWKGFTLDDVCLLFAKKKITFWIDSHQVCLQLPQSALCPCSAHGSVSQLSIPSSGKCFEYTPMITV